MECKYCGAQIPEGETLCPECGKAAAEPAEEEKKTAGEAPEAQKAADDREKTAGEDAETEASAQAKKASRSIRAARNKAAAAEAAREAREEQLKKRKARKRGGSADETGKKRKGKMIALISGIAVAVVLAILIPVLILLNRPAPFILYEKGSELYIELYKDGSYRQLTTSLSKAMSSTEVNYIKEGCVYCEKTGVLYYYDNYVQDPQVTNDVVFHLYSVDLHVKSAAELMPQVTAQNVTDFAVTTDGKFVYYMTEFGQLYRADAEGNRVKICENAASFTMLEQGSRTVCFVQTRPDANGAQSEILYTVDKAGAAGVLASGIESSVINKKAGWAAYAADGSVYVVKNGKKTTHIAAAAGNDLQLLSVASDGRVYYTVSAEDGVKLSDMIKDELADADAAVREGDAGYALKVKRDRIRAAVKNAPLFDGTVGTLGTAKNGKKATLAERVGYTAPGTGKAADRLVFGAYTVNTDYRADITALANALDVFTAESVRTYLLKSDDVITDFRLSVVSQGEAAFVTSLDPAVARQDEKAFKKLQIRFAPNGKAMYYLADPSNDTGAGTLMRVKFSGKTAKQAEAVYQKVFTYGFTDNGKLITLRSPVNNGSPGTGAYYACELFVNDRQVDENVVYYASKLYDETLYQYFNVGGSRFYYPVNHSAGNKDDFRYYNGSGKKDVISGVHSAAAVSKNAVFFLDSYNVNEGSGTLQYYNGKKTVQRDSFVQNVFCPPTAED